MERVYHAIFFKLVVLNGMCLLLFYLPTLFAKFNLSHNYSAHHTVDKFTVFHMPNLLSSYCPCYQCPDCPRTLRSSRGLTQHCNLAHQVFTPPPDDGDEDEDESKYTYHAYLFLNGKHDSLCLQVQSSRLLIMNIAIPCDKNGGNLPDPPPAPSVPLPSNGQDPTSWNPFRSQLDFDFAYYHFVEVQNSAGAIDKVLDMWQATILKYGENIPWTNTQDLYDTIDLIQLGDAPWKVHKIYYQGPCPPDTLPKWMTETYELCTSDSQLVLHNQLASSEFKGKTNFVPYQQFNGKGRCVWSNLMSADWAWKQVIRLTQYFFKSML